MNMQIASLEILEQAEFSSAQARAIGRVMEADAAARREDLATKADLKTTLADLKAELKTDLAGLKTEMKTEMAALRSDLRVEIHDGRSELVRWVFMATIGQVTLSAGIMYFLLQNTR